MTARTKPEAQTLGNIYEKVAHLIASTDRIRKEGDLELGGKTTKFLEIDAIIAAIKPEIRNLGIVIVPVLVSAKTKTYTAQEPPAHVPQATEAAALHALKTWGGRIAKFQTREKVVYDWLWIDSQNPDSRFTVRTSGESMDSQDKATQKATTSAYKTMLIRTLMLETGEPELENEQRVDGDVEEERANRGQQMTAAAAGNPVQPVAASAPEDDNDAGGIPAVKKQLRELMGKHKLTMPQVDFIGNEVNAPKEKPVWFNQISGLKKLVGALEDDAKRTELLQTMTTGEVK